MSQYRAGQIVDVPCDVQEGAFPNERLVTIDTVEGVMSGFIRSEYVRGKPGSRGSIRGKVARVSGNIVEVELLGSFFTSTGMAAVQASTLQSVAEHRA